MKSITISLISFIFTLYYRILGLTCRVEIEGEDILIRNINNNQPTVAMAWHEALIFPYFIARKYRNKFHAIISQHIDGEIISRTAHALYVDTIRGSTNRAKEQNGKASKDRGGTRVILQAIRILRSGGVVFITPDGPRGPRKELKENFLKVIEKTGASLLLIGSASSKQVTLRTWDRMKLPLPFGHVKIHIKECDSSTAQHIEAELIKLQEEAQNSR